MRIYWLNTFEKGKLGIMPRPRGNDWLIDEIIHLKKRNVNTVISLLENQEAIELGLEKEEYYCINYGIEFINYPIKDVGVPQEPKEFIRLIESIDEKLENNERIVIHCRMGIGRSSVLAAGVLIKNGINADEVFDVISKFRTLKVPDTEEQKEWLINLFD